MRYYRLERAGMLEKGITYFNQKRDKEINIF